MKKGTIIKVSGPLVVAKGIPEARMYDMVRVGEKNLIGEIIQRLEKLLGVMLMKSVVGECLLF